MSGESDHLPLGNGGEAPSDPLPPREESEFERDRILPAVAFYPSIQDPFDWKEHVLYVSAERLVWGKKAGDRPLPEAAAERDGHRVLLAALGKEGREILLQQITKVELGDKGPYGGILQLNFHYGHLLRVTAGNETVCWIVPADVAEILSRAFQVVCPERFERVKAFLPARPLAHHIFKPFFYLQLIVFPVLGLYAAMGNFSSSPPVSNTNNALEICLLFSVLAELWIIFVLVLHLLLTLLRKQVDGIPPQVVEDRSQKKPLAMPVTGALLKYGGALVFLAYFLRMHFFPPPQEWSNHGIVLNILASFSYLILTLVVFVGYRLSLVPAEKSLSSDTRAPILYLRAFDDDGGNSYNPTGAAANFLGLKTAGFLWNVNPVRILRMVINRPADTAEEQLASFLPGIGPFVAIGKPGEGVPLGGAARLYVPDDQWQAKVLELIDRSQFVVLQPAETSGVWWEVEQMLQRVPGTRVLLTLVNFAGKSNRYTLFRWRFERLTERELPRLLGGAVFCKFQDDWKPEMLPSHLHTPFLWPIVGCGFNFKKTLRPFLDIVRGRAPRPPARVSSVLARRLSGGVAMIFWFLLVIGLGWLTISAGNRWRALQALASNQKGLDAISHQDFGGAIRDFTRALSYDPTFAVAYMNRAFSHSARQEYLPAIADYSQTIRLNPASVESYLSRGVLYQKDGDSTSAMADFDQAIKLDPKNGVPYFDRGFAFFGLGQEDAALGDFQQAISLAPDYAPAFEEAALILATSPQAELRNGTQAVNYALKAGALEKWSDPGRLDVLAAAYAEAGDFDNAIKWEGQYLGKPGLSVASRSEATDRLALYRAHAAFHRIY
jgi:tetratricopeptide (TPR) repeat protein